MLWVFYSWRSQLSKFYYFLGLHGSSGKLTGSTSSLNKLSVQSSGNRRSQSSSLLDMGNMSASDLDVADRTKFDKVKLNNRYFLNIYISFLAAAPYCFKHVQWFGLSLN